MAFKRNRRPASLRVADESLESQLMIHFTRPSCQTLLQTEEEQDRVLVGCPNCKSQMKVSTQIASPSASVVPTVSNSAGSTQTGRPGGPSPSAQPIEVRLRELLAKHGPGLCTDTRRCESMIRDICGDRTKEAHLLILSLKQQVPTDLLAMPKGASPMPILERLRQRLQDRLSTAETHARWTVQCWAVALRVVTEADLQPEEIPEDRPQNPRTEPYLRAYDDAAEKLFGDISVIATGKDGHQRRFPVPMIWADEQEAAAYVLKDCVGGVVDRIRLPLLAIHCPGHFPDSSRAATAGTTAFRIDYTLFAWTMFPEEMTQIVQNILGAIYSLDFRDEGSLGVPLGSELVLVDVGSKCYPTNQDTVNIIKYRFNLAVHALLPQADLQPEELTEDRPPSTSSVKRVELEDVLVDPDSFDGQFVQMRGTYEFLFIDDAFFVLEQGDHEMWVFYSQLPKEQKRMILRESEAKGRTVIVEGVLDCRDGTPELTASNVAIEGLAPRK